MKRFSVLLILLLPPFVNAQVDSLKESLEYYPLQIGDYWQYKISDHWLKGYEPSPSPYSVEVVGDTTLLNGQTYKVLLKQDIPSHGDVKYMFERIDSLSGSVFQYDTTIPSHERQIDSLFAKSGDVIHASKPGDMIFTDSTYWKTTCLSIQNDTLFGVPTQTMKLSDLFASNDDQYTLAKGFGFCYSSDLYDLFIRQVFLVYVKINGAEYGSKIVGVKERNVVPLTLALFQNYPNPFNPTTRIDYSIPNAGHVTLKIHNVLGQEVALLFSGFQYAGNYSTMFDGSKFSSGVYFYRLQTGTTQLTKKLLLIK